MSANMMFVADIDCDNCGGTTRVESESNIILEDVMCACGAPCYNPEIAHEAGMEEIFLEELPDL